MFHFLNTNTFWMYVIYFSVIIALLRIGEALEGIASELRRQRRKSKWER